MTPRQLVGRIGVDKGQHVQCVDRKIVEPLGLSDIEGMQIGGACRGFDWLRLRLGECTADDSVRPRSSV